MRRAFVPSLLTAALVLGGCSTVPIQYFKGPVTPEAARASLPEALRYLDASKSHYQAAVEAQMKGERDLTNALVGGGALIMALALGGVSANAIAGTALLGGTAYTLGNINLPRQRVLVYLAGVDALSCAQKAVGPLYVGSAQLMQLDKALTGLQDSVDALGSAGPPPVPAGLKAALVQGRALVPVPLANSPDGPALVRAIEIGGQVLLASETTLRAGRDLLQASDRAARDLVTAVNGIDEAVVRSLVSATPELSAVPGLVAGLAGASGSFAPGAGVDRQLASKLLALSGAPGEGGAQAMTKSGQKSAIQLATEAIVDAAQRTAALDSTARGFLPPQAVPWPEDAFKLCGVAQVVSALGVSVPSLQFAAGVDDRQTFEIQGGVKPYFVRLEGPAVDGLTVNSPIRFDNQAEVIVVGSKVKAKVDARIRVLDSSPTARTALTVPVSIAGAPVSAPTEPAAQIPPEQKPAGSVAGGSPGSTASGSVDADLKKLKQMASFKLDGKSFLLTAVPVRNGDVIEVAVQCPDASAHKRSALAKALLVEAGLTEPPKRKLMIRAQPATCAVD